MITSEEFKTEQMKISSRLFSPVFEAKENKYCFDYYYNINGNDDDGFRISIEDYLSHEIKHLRVIKKETHIEDKWYNDEIQLEIQSEFFRVIR